MSIAELEAQLAGLADAFIAANAGRRPTQADIAADVAWSAAYTRKRALEREAAVQLPGGCSVYIVRRRRFCTHAAADGLGGLCSEHAAEFAAANEVKRGAEARKEPQHGEAGIGLHRVTELHVEPS